MADPDAFESYAPGIFWSSQFFEDGFQSNLLLVPMDSRAVADTASTEEYTYSRVGGAAGYRFIPMIYRRRVLS